MQNRATFAITLLFSVTCVTLSQVTASADTQSAEKRDSYTPEKLQLINGLMQREFYSMAENEIRDFLDTDPPERYKRRARFLLIKALREQGKSDQALNIVQQMRVKTQSESKQDSSRLHMTAGDILYNNENYQQAAKHFKSLLSNDKTAVREAATYYLGKCYIQQEKTRNAKAVFKRIARNPFDSKQIYRPYAAYSLGNLYLKQDKLKEAFKWYEKVATSQHVPEELKGKALYKTADTARALGKTQQTIKYFQQLIQNYPETQNTSRSVRKLMRLYLQNDTPDKALTLVENTLDNDVQIGDKYKLDYLQALALQKKENFDAALKLFKQVINNNETTDKYKKLARFQSIYCLLQTDQFDSLLEMADIFLEKHKNSKHVARAAYYKGIALFKEEKFASAAQAFSRALNNKKEPAAWETYVDVLRYLADCYTQLEKFDKAATVYRQLAHTDDADIDTVAMLMKAGDLLHKAGKQQKAINLYQRIIQHQEAQKNDVENAVVQVARLYLEQDKSADAESFLHQQLLKDDFSTPRIQLLLGLAQYKQQKFDKAESTLKKCLRKEKLSTNLEARTRYLLGASMLHTDKTEKALEQFATILDMPQKVQPEFEKSLILRVAKLYHQRRDYSKSLQLIKQILPAENNDINYQATLLKAELLYAQSKYQETIALLQKICDKRESQKTASSTDTNDNEVRNCTEAYSLLGAAYMEVDNNDQAFYAFSKSLRNATPSQNAQARAYWGLAKIFYEEQKWEKSLDKAVNGFILVNSPTYTPRCMLLAVQALVKMKNFDEALTTWKELKKRFPAYAQQNKNSPEIKKLLKNKNN